MEISVRNLEKYVFSVEDCGESEILRNVRRRRLIQQEGTRNPEHEEQERPCINIRESVSVTGVNEYDTCDNDYCRNERDPQTEGEVSSGYLKTDCEN